MISRYGNSSRVVVLVTTSFGWKFVLLMPNQTKFPAAAILAAAHPINCPLDNLNLTAKTHHIKVVNETNMISFFHDLDAISN